MTRPKMQDWREYKSQIDWSDMYYAARMAKAQSGVVERARQRGVEMSAPVSDKSPGGLPQAYVTKNADGTPAYTTALFNPQNLLDLLAQGIPQREIARRWGVAKSTIQYAVKRLHENEKGKRW